MPLPALACGDREGTRAGVDCVGRIGGEAPAGPPGVREPRVLVEIIIGEAKLGPQSGLRHGGARHSRRHFNSPPRRDDDWTIREGEMPCWLRALVNLYHDGNANYRCPLPGT